MCWHYFRTIYEWFLTYLQRKWRKKNKLINSIKVNWLQKLCLKLTSVGLFNGIEVNKESESVQSNTKKLAAKKPDNVISILGNAFVQYLVSRLCNKVLPEKCAVSRDSFRRKWAECFFSCFWREINKKGIFRRWWWRCICKRVPSRIHFRYD